MPQERMVIAQRRHGGSRRDSGRTTTRLPDELLD